MGPEAKPTRDRVPVLARKLPPKAEHKEGDDGPSGSTIRGVTPGLRTRSPRDVLELQRLAGNRATTKLLARSAPTVQRAVSPSATWPPAGGGPEEVLIDQLDALIPAAEAAATSSVQANKVIRTAREASYIRRPNPTTWGCVVEEKLDPPAAGIGWSTQQRLIGARPDYYRFSNNIHVFADLTTAGQAGIGGNHITPKLQKAGYTSADADVAAGDVTHMGTNPRGIVGPAVVLGNATMPQMLAFQHYRGYRDLDSGYNDKLAKLVRQHRKVTHSAFTTKWSDKKRQRFASAVDRALHVNLKPRKKGNSK